MATSGTLRLNANETLILQRAVQHKLDGLADDTPAVAMERAALVLVQDKLTDYAARQGWL